MNKYSVDRWLAAYVDAWKTYDREKIATLFAADVEYRYHPYDEPMRGREAVVATWLGEVTAGSASTRDEEGTYEATYSAIAIDGDLAVATGSTSYRTTPGGPIDKVFDNCFIIRFDVHERCREFTEWYMQRPSGA
jgi:hypothetical protein